MLVEKIKVPLMLPDVAAALTRAWAEKGDELSPRVLPWLLALVRFEAGRVLWNYNLGNITTEGKDGESYVQFEGNSRKFKAYDSLESASRDFAAFIRRPHKSPIVAAAEAGDFSRFWREYQARWVVAQLSPAHEVNFRRVLSELGGPSSRKLVAPFSFLTIAALSGVTLIALAWRRK